MVIVCSHFRRCSPLRHSQSIVGVGRRHSAVVRMGPVSGGLLLWLLLSGLTHTTSDAATVEPEGEQATAEPEGEQEPEPEGQQEAEPTSEGETTSEPEVEPEGSGNMMKVCVFVTLYSIIIVMILVGNILVAVIIVKNQNLRGNTSNLYLLSLVSARASIAVFVIPARITGMFSEEYLGSILCKLCHFAAFGSSAASIFSIISIAITKYIQVTHVNSQPLTMKQSILVILVIWVFGFLYATRAAITNDMVVINTGSVSIWSCTIAPQYRPLNKYFIFVDIACLFLIPLIIIIFCYSRVIHKLSISSTLITVGSEKQPVTKIDSQSYKAIRMLVVLMLLFTICTASPMALKLYILWGGDYFDSYDVVETVIYMFSYSNSWFNLIVFAYFRDDLRGAFVTMCRQSRCCKNKVTAADIKEEIEKSQTDPEKDKALRMMEF